MESSPIFDPAQNRLLAFLPEDDWAWLLPALRRVSLAQVDVIQDARVPVQLVYFPISCVISLLTTMQDGVTVEAASIGPEGALGLASLGAPRLAIGRGVVQVAGEAWTIEGGELRRRMHQFPALDDALRRCQAVLFLQVMQTLGCNQIHSAQQRMARWLLSMFGRAGVTELALTHEILADALAIRRPTVTALARDFRQHGALDFGRGRIRLRDRTLLEAMSCGCHAQTDADIARMFEKS